MDWANLIGTAGTVVSGLLSMINNKNMEYENEKESARKQSLYGTRANEDAMTRSENARIIGTLDRKAKERADVSAAKNKIVGGTPESEVADKKIVSKSYADALGGIAANESTRRDKMLDNLETAREKDFTNKMERMQKRNETYAALAANAANAAKGFMGGGTNADTSDAAGRLVFGSGNRLMGKDGNWIQLPEADLSDFNDWLGKK